MFSAWPVVKFLFQVVAPTLPEIISTISNMKHQDTAHHLHESAVEVRVKEIERRLSLQLDLIDKLTVQLTGLQLIIRRALTMSIIALTMAILGFAILLYQV